MPLWVGPLFVVLPLITFVAWAVFMVDAIGSIGAACFQHGRDLRDREERAIPDGF